jgi:hypothetical protein
MTRCCRVFVVVAALAPAYAFAQTPIYPNVPDAPTTLSPGAAGNQGPPPAQPAPAPQRPNVVIVGPDGKVIGGDSEPAAPGGYYVQGNDTTVQVPDEVHLGATPELHVVRRGDTLWDICAFYFNDPWQWPKVWSYNAQVTNPHWIFPGDLVRLLPRGLFAEQGGMADPEGGGTPVAARPADPVPAPARRLEVGVRNVAFVEKADLAQSIVIDGSVDEKLLLGNGDQVYLSYPKRKPPEVGKRYSVYQPGRQVKGYGSYVKVLGTLEVLSIPKDKRARAVLLEVNQEVERGAKVGPLVTRFKNVPPVQPKVNAQGSIVAMLTKDQLIGQGEIVFVALGKRSGLEVGNRMYVVRRGDAFPDIMSTEIGSDDRRFPARALGEIVIVEVGANISIGLVTLAVQEMSIGDLVMMQKPKT